MVQQFFRFLGLVLAVFFLITFCVVLFHMIGTGANFAISWRWYHDSILIPIFWYLSPLFLIFFGINKLLVKYNRTNQLAKIPYIFHQFIVLFFLLAIGSLVSQVFGGCIWFLPTEQWWSRFVPPFASEPEMIIFYIFASLLVIVSMLAYWKEFVYKSIDNQSPLAHNLST